MGEESAVLGRLLSDHTVLNKGTDDEQVSGADISAPDKNG